jgi:HlyD family secretion protein
MRYSFLPLLVLAVLSASCSKNNKADDAEGAVTPVQVAKAARQTIHRYVTAEAVLYPLRQASIVPKISAPVARFVVQRGDHVREGQLIAVLEHADLSAATRESKELYEQAQATYVTTTKGSMVEDLTKAKADVLSSKQALDAAQKLYENRQELVREGALAQKLVDDARVSLAQAQSAFDTAQQHLTSLETVSSREQLKSAEAQAAAAKAHYESAAAQSSYAEVRSPISGVVSDRPLNIGEMASGGSAIATVVDLSRVVARANVPVAEAAALKAGNAATISNAAGELHGKVTVVSPAVDPNTTTVQVWVEAANTKEVFKPGSTVQISADAGAIPDAIVVPASALLSGDDGGEKVMLAGSDNLAHEHDVKTGVRSGDSVQITEGLKEGDQVITQGALGLDDKAKIRIGTGAEPAGGKDE